MALTPADIEAIVEAVYARHKAELSFHVPCRFEAADPEMVKEALAFFKGFNDALDDTKKTARRWIVVALLTGTVAILGKGVWMYLKEAAKTAAPK